MAVATSIGTTGIGTTGNCTLGDATRLFDALGTWASSGMLLGQDAPPAGEGLFPSSTLFVFGIIAMLFYFMLIRPQRREEANRKAMLANLKKNDRVVTHSGMYGIVASVKHDADEVTLRVDESSNTKIRMTLASVSRVLGDATDENKGSK